MAMQRRHYRNLILGFAAAVAIAWGGRWFINQMWYAEVVLVRASGADLSLTIDGKPVSPSAVKNLGDATFSTFHPPMGAHRLVVSDAQGSLLDTQTKLEPQSVTTYVLFCGGGLWLTEQPIEYGGAPLPDFSSFNSGPQAMDGRVVDVDGQETSFLTRTDDAAGMALLKSLGTRVHTKASLLNYGAKAVLWPWEEVPASVMSESGMETLTRLRVLSLDDVAVAQRLRAAAADEDQRHRADALEAAEGSSAPRP